MGYHASVNRMETHPHRGAATNRQRALDDIVHHLLGDIIGEIKYVRKFAAVHRKIFAANFAN
jgi:hypothetical protein